MFLDFSLMNAIRFYSASASDVNRLAASSAPACDHRAVPGKNEFGSLLTVYR
jgi:hypothetical protein